MTKIMEAIVAGVHGCCMWTKKVFIVFKTICLHLQTTQPYHVFTAHHPICSYKFPFFAFSLNALGKGEGLWKIFIDFLLKQCCFCMGARLKEYSYRSQDNFLDFTRRALRDLYCSNTSRNSHSEVSQKCTLPSLYSHCQKTLPLENQNLGSRCMWTRDI